MTFEEACRKILVEVRQQEYPFKGKKAVPTLWLQLKYQKIARKYFPAYKGDHKRYLFPASIVTRLAKEMDVYVTDLIRYPKK